MKKISSKDYEKLKSDYLLLKQEFENYKEKTIDKMKDLEFINILYDKTKKENEELKSKINKISNQNVSLQNKLDEFKNNKNISIEQNIKRERSKIYSNGNLSRKNGYNNDFENVINNNININDNNIINNNNNN